LRDDETEDGAMRTVELGHTGEQVSQLALGCMVMVTGDANYAASLL
jgi:aryl-alcohol dehydrogenase-like predicted oxidoreductase